MPYSKHPNRTCKNCGKIYHVSTNSSYCKNCRTENKKCVICGKVFTIKRCHSPNINTCSLVCRARLRWGDVEKNRGERRDPCANCGKPITRKNISHGKRKKKHNFCNTKCYGEWRHKNIFKDAHPRYTGGYSYAYGSGWIKQKELALARDKVCQRCGKTSNENGKELDVHHIKPFRFFGKVRAKEAHNLNNLTCLCSSCHQIVEWETFRSESS